jgi:hypothetical protein
MSVTIVSVGGASDREIHGVVRQQSEAAGQPTLLNTNYLIYNAPYIAIAQDYHTAQLRDLIFALPSMAHGGAASDRSLLLAGKSAGAIQIWNFLRLQFSSLTGVRRIAAVLIDPHGAVINDGQVGPYKDSQDLWWPGNWPVDKDRFRVWHVCQQQRGLTGANFPDHRLYESCLIREEGISHKNIPMHGISRGMINRAVQFVSA